MAEKRRACERLPLPLLPLLIASCGEAEEARRGEERGIKCAHSPTSRDYYALTACGNRCRKTCGQLWATENPRLGLGVEVVGPRPAATSCRARGLAGFFQPEGATRYAGGEWPARNPACAQPTPAFRLQKFRQDGAPNRSRLPAAGSSR